MFRKINDILQNGGIIAFPTDTVWGIGCLPSHKQAVQKIYGANADPISQKTVKRKVDGDVTAWQRHAKRTERILGDVLIGEFIIGIWA